jgi:hypothetical protein
MSSPPTVVVSDVPSTGAEPVVPFFRKKKAPAKARPTALRKRAASDDDNDDELGESSSVIKAGRKVAYNPLNQSTGLSKRRRKLTGEDESSDEGANEDVGVKYSEKTMARRRSRSRSKSPSRIDGHDKTETAAPGGAGPNDGLYHGTANYGSQLPKGGARFGPVKGPDNVRTITLVDYQPDVCKDYKGTYTSCCLKRSCLTCSLLHKIQRPVSVVLATRASSCMTEAITCTAGKWTICIFPTSPKRECTFPCLSVFRTSGSSSVCALGRPRRIRLSRKSCRSLASYAANRSRTLL